MYCFNYEEKDFRTISTSWKIDMFDNLESAYAEGDGFFFG